MEYALKQDRKLSLRQHYLDQVPPDSYRDWVYSQPVADRCMSTRQKHPISIIN